MRLAFGVFEGLQGTHESVINVGRQIIQASIPDQRHCMTHGHELVGRIAKHHLEGGERIEQPTPVTSITVKQELGPGIATQAID